MKNTALSKNNREWLVKVYELKGMREAFKFLSLKCQLEEAEAIRDLLIYRKHCQATERKSIAALCKILEIGRSAFYRNAENIKSLKAALSEHEKKTGLPGRMRQNKK